MALSEMMRVLGLNSQEKAAFLDDPCTMSSSVLILGAGVIGLNVALACVRRGFSVTIVERLPQRREGCSFGNAGMVVPSHFMPLAAPGMVSLGLRMMWNPESPFYIKPRLDATLMQWGWQFFRAASQQRADAASVLLRDFGLLSRQCFERMALDFGLERRGLLMLCKTPHALHEEARMAGRAHELGIPAEVLDARGTAALDPGVTMDVCGSVYYPLDCHLSPARFMAALEDELIRCGVKFLWETEVTGFDCDGKKLRAIHTACGPLEADEVLLCGGVWSSEIVTSLGLNLPMQAGKGYSLTLENPRELPSLCSICTEARLAVTPMGGALRVGGTMELAGIDTSINQRRVRGIVKSFPHYFPTFKPQDFNEVKPWSGLRPVSPDGLPYVGRTSRWENLTIATGHAMMGLSLAPATGEIVANILTGQQPNIALDLLSPDRFG